eukprot:gb/GFBE01040461.1/.p1 GENE.gb/GFBE01040461.1/~~gb/GFBE01040461.1/.p1  ORF type:complete len:194 (+),score=35.89 gb/GFBE01040461.1/:1-582(+)
MPAPCSLVVTRPHQMSPAYVDFLADIASQRRKAATREAVGQAVASQVLREWLLVVQRQSGSPPGLPDGPRRCIEAFLGDAWDGFPPHAATMRAIAAEVRFRKQGELHEYLEHCLSEVALQHILPEANRGEMRAEIRISASVVEEVGSYSRTVRGGLSPDALIEQKLRAWGYEITNVMRFEDGDGDISMILDWA